MKVLQAPSHAIVAGNALWAFAKLGHNPGAGLLTAAATRLTALLATGATPQNMANWLLPYVTFKTQPPARLLDGIVGAIEASPEVRLSQDTASTLSDISHCCQAC